MDAADRARAERAAQRLPEKIEAPEPYLVMADAVVEQARERPSP